MDIKTNTIYYTTEDISIYDTTGILTEEDIRKMKENIAKHKNELTNCFEEC